MKKKSVSVSGHDRSKPSTAPRKKPDYPKPGPKTVSVNPHRRSPPKK